MKGNPMDSRVFAAALFATWQGNFSVRFPVKLSRASGERCIECGESMPPGKPRKCKSCRERKEGESNA